MFLIVAVSLPIFVLLIDLVISDYIDDRKRTERFIAEITVNPEFSNKADAPAEPLVFVPSDIIEGRNPELREADALLDQYWTKYWASKGLTWIPPERHYAE